MRKPLPLRFLLLYSALAFLIALCSIGSCRDVKAVDEVLPSDTLMRQFSQSPPIVQDIFLQKLAKADKQGNTVLLTTRFSAEDARLRGINSLPLTIDENRVLKLNDRGIDGDEKAGDGIFSISLPASDEELTAVINNNNAVLDKQKNTILDFAGRVAVTRRDFKKFIFDSLKLNRPIPFEVFFLSVVDATTLPDIRDKSLMIRDVSVVDDVTRTYDPCRTANRGNANGVWSFKTLIANMTDASTTPEQFLINWVDQFLFNAHTLASSTDNATLRQVPKERLVRAWMKNSGLSVPATGIPANWQVLPLKAEEFPVRLLAIINRLDLRGNGGYGGFNNSGEGRFVFTFVDGQNSCTNGGNGPGTMTFILEYGIPIKSCMGLVEYAKKWWDLRNEPFGSTFNSKLEEITKVFTDKNANPSRPNGSALNHLRTNDFLRANFNINIDPWDIRDFEIDATTHKLKIVHPNREPMERSNGFGTVIITDVKLASMVTFANSIPFTPSNLNPNYTIPDDIKGIHAPMRVDPPIDYHWVGNAANVINPFKRREFSFNTCSGCHKGETNNAFTHVRPRSVGSPAALSGFMTGLGADDENNPGEDDADPMGNFWVRDPGPTPEPMRGFNEAKFRATSLEKLAFNTPCIKIPKFPNDLVAVVNVIRFRPLNMTH